MISCNKNYHKLFFFLESEWLGLVKLETFRLEGFLKRVLVFQNYKAGLLRIQSCAEQIQSFFQLLERVNIRLLEESEEKFEHRLKFAEKFRDQAEVIMKYNFLIESMQSPTTPLPLKIIDCILTRIFSVKRITSKEFRVHLQFSKLLPNEQHDTKRMLWKDETTHLVCESPVYLKLGFQTLQDFKENFFKNLKEFVIKTSEFASPVSAEKLKSLVQEVDKKTLKKRLYLIQIYQYKA